MDSGRKGTDSRAGVGRDNADHRVPDEGTRETTEGRIPVDELIIQVITGTASPFEVERLKRWRELAPENEEYFQETTQVWELTAPEPVEVSSGPPAVDAILAAAPPSLRLDPAPTSTRIPRRSGSLWVRWGLLAASLAAVGLGIQVFGPHGPTPFAVHQAGQNETLTVTLQDGSFARLAKGSLLREWEADDQRVVSLNGRAFFAVARDESHPFVIQAGAGEVQVLGTRFQVTAEGDELETLVVEGLVRVSNEEGSVELPAGSMARMSVGDAPEAVEVDDLFAFLNWPEGILVYQATPLAQVVDEVSRHYGRTLSVDGSGLSQRRVTAWFQGEPFEAVVESLCIVTEAVCRTEGGGVTMGMGGSGGMR